MKQKNVNLVWNVLRWDTNKKKVEVYNVFSDKDFVPDLYKKIKSKKITNYEELKERVKNYLMYYYWSKTECEMSIGPIPYNIKDINIFKKIDIYSQLEINLDLIVKYIITEMDIKF